MGDSKISSLPGATLPLVGTEVFALADGTTISKKASSSSLASYCVSYDLPPPSGDTTGATDSANFAAFEAAAAAALQTISGFTSQVGFLSCCLHAGDYYINASGAFMGNNGPSVKGIGIRWVGKGPNVTRVHYNPGSSGPMCVNTHWLSPTFEDITFFGGDPNSDFLQSLEQGGLTNIQDYRFRNCVWNGQWQNICLVTGGNNNSEWKWDDCTVDAQILNWLLIPQSQTATFSAGTTSIAIANSPISFPLKSSVTFGTTVGNISASTTYYIVASTTTSIQVATSPGGAAVTPNTNGSATATVGSDQFLNFYWHNCKFWDVQNGSWITAYYGGHFRIINGDVSNHNPTANTYLFNLMGTSHAQGVCNFAAFGVRVEHKSNFSLFLQSQWPQGNIIMYEYDGSSQVGSRPANQQYVLIAPVNQAGCSVAFRDCSLPGQHVYNYSSNNYNFQQDIEYTNCNILQNNSAGDFVVSSGTNSGGIPVVRFRNCKNMNNAATVGWHEIVDCDLNWQLSCGSLATARYLNIVGANSDAPINGGTLTYRLPLNTLVTQVLLLKTANSNSGAYNYTLQSNEATPTVLNPTGGFSGSNAGALSYQVFNPTQPFYATTDNQRTLTLTDTQNRTGIFTNYLLLVCCVC